MTSPSSQARASEEAGVLLETPAMPGSLRITNTAAAPVSIERAIAVEKQQPSGWMRLGTEFNAVATCGTPAQPPAVSIPAGSVLTVVPWRGFSCSGQCTYACRANIYFGPGTFRFVVATVPGGAKVIGPAFSLPAYSPGR